MDDEQLQEMAESIRTYGVLIPAIVRKDGKGRYEIISGHRRKRSCELAGIAEMPVVIRQMSGDKAAVSLRGISWRYLENRYGDRADKGIASTNTWR